MILKVNGQRIDLGNNYQVAMIKYKNDPGALFVYTTEIERLRLASAGVTRVKDIHAPKKPTNKGKGKVVQPPAPPKESTNKESNPENKKDSADK